MKKLTLLLLVGMSSAAHYGMAQAVVIRGQAQLMDDPARAIIEKSAPIPAGQNAKAGAQGVLMEFPEGTRVRVAPNSEFQFGPGVPSNPVMSAPLEAPNATSAIKSILTRRDQQAYRSQSQRNVTHHLLVLRSGSLIVNERGKPTDVRVMNTMISAEDAYYSVTMISPGKARVTVSHGEVTIASPNAFSQQISEGEFAIFASSEGSDVLAEAPRKASGSDRAVADLTALQLNQTGKLEPVGEQVNGFKDPNDLEPVGELITDPALPVPVVGAGPSVPFDLKNPRILSSPNRANTTGLVQSPAQP